MEHTRTQTDDRTLMQHTGWAYWPIAFIARLPFAMMTVGVLMLVVSATGSVRVGGLKSAAVGVVIAGPLIGDLVDRYGQRRVLVPVGLANGILLALFPVIVMSGMPEGVLLASALAIGLTAPQAAAMSRSRLLTIITARLAPGRRATSRRSTRRRSSSGRSSSASSPRSSRPGRRSRSPRR